MKHTIVFGLMMLMFAVLGCNLSGSTASQQIIETPTLLPQLGITTKAEGHPTTTATATSTDEPATEPPTSTITPLPSATSAAPGLPPGILPTPTPEPSTATPVPPPVTPTWTPTGINPTTAPTLPPTVTLTPTHLLDTIVGDPHYYAITREQIGDIPANTRVRISHGGYPGGERVYVVFTLDDQSMAEARPDQLILPPDFLPPPTITPTLLYQEYIGMGGLHFVTLEQVGPIPAGARVGINYVRYDRGTVYGLMMDDGVTMAEAWDYQFTMSSEVTPGPTPTFTPDPNRPTDIVVTVGPPTATWTPGTPLLPSPTYPTSVPTVTHTFQPPTPTAVWGAYVGTAQYALVVTVPVDGIAAGTPVRLSYSRYDAGRGVTFYGIVTGEGQSAEVGEALLALR